MPITVPTAAYRTGDFSGAIAADGNKTLTDPFGVSTGLLAGEMFDNTSLHPVTGTNGIVYQAANPFPNNTIPLSRQDPSR
ncbi:MAG TPA: hypothetical protein VHY84_15590 [Bryobacteraceae bacterium]|jgi:hypothetical protein|nr:hypothetical protein [Bryobacteraceae bacterium]